MKTGRELKKMHQAGKIYLGGGDTGEYTVIRWPIGGGKLSPWTGEPIDNSSFSQKGFNSEDMGEEFLIIDHPNVMSLAEYNWCKLLFQETNK